MRWRSTPRERPCGHGLFTLALPIGRPILASGNYPGAPMTEDLWHTALVHIRGSDVRGDTGQTSGMTRLEAISGKSSGSSKLWMGQTHVAPVTRSGDHHQDRKSTRLYVVSGHPAFVFADGDREVRLETEPGDYIFVPPYVPHREENPGDEEAVVVIARSSQEGIVVNLESRWSAVDRTGDAAATGE